MAITEPTDHRDAATQRAADRAWLINALTIAMGGGGLLVLGPYCVWAMGPIGWLMFGLTLIGAGIAWHINRIMRPITDPATTRLRLSAVYPLMKGEAWLLGCLTTVIAIVLLSHALTLFPWLEMLTGGRRSPLGIVVMLCLLGVARWLFSRRLDHLIEQAPTA